MIRIDKAKYLELMTRYDNDISAVAAHIADAVGLQGLFTYETTGFSIQELRTLQEAVRAAQMALRAA